MKKKVKTQKPRRHARPRLPSLRGKKVLITGGLGFIGSNLAHRCLSLGARVTVFDCLDPNSGGNLYNIRGIKSAIEVVFGNILNLNEISRHIVDKDIIFNCAASTSHPFSMREPLNDLDVNGRGVINLLEAARRLNREIKFVHLGTTTQLGRLQYRPADEEHPEFPTDIYSANKSLSEKYVLIYGTAYGMPVVVVRLPNVFGPRACINNPEFTFVNYFLGQALQDKDITVFGDGRQLRNVIYVDDTVTALILTAVNKQVDGKMLFAVGDKHYSVAEIAKMIVRYIGSGKVRFIKWPAERKKIEVGDAVISNKKIKKLLDWQPKDNLKSGLIKTKKYYQRCLKHYLI